MSWSNEELIEELMWEAHEKGLGEKLIDLATEIQSREKLERVSSFQMAYDQLKIGDFKISKFRKNRTGAKELICYDCETPIKEYWRMDEEEKMAADRKMTIPAQYCENCKKYDK